MPWGSTIGEVRTYAYTGLDFSADRWYRAVKDGHTFVTNGPMMEFTVGDLIPGDALQLSVAGKVRVHARGWAPESIGAPAAAHTSPVYVVVGGNKVRSADAALIAAKRKKELEFIEGRLQEPKYVKEYGPGEADALRERIMQARWIYEKLKGHSSQ
jgi:hypothetical protein